MSKATDIRVVGARLYFLPLQTRLPLKFGTETVTSVTCARASIRVADRQGRVAEGWGETPLSVQWVWPSAIPYERRHDTLRRFSVALAKAWTEFAASGHPIEVGHDFQELGLPKLLHHLNAESRAGEPMPWLAALVCCSVFDQTLHDAYGNLLHRPVYETYGREFISRDLAAFMTPAADANVSFEGKYPHDFLLPKRVDNLPAWHLVGGLDPLDKSELTGNEPTDGYPVLLAEWIRRDGLKCLKVKLRGNDAQWDFNRVVQVGRIGMENGSEL